MKQRESWKDITGYVLFGISLFLLGVSLFLCGSSDIWYDELFTMGMANQSLHELVYITSQDVHPPLYYMLVKLALDIVGSPDRAIQVIVAKVVSVIPFGLCFVYAITVIRKYWGMLTAGLFTFLLMGMPNIAGYTVEVRMYGWSLFFVTAMLLHGFLLIEHIKIVNDNNIYVNINIIAMTLYALAACYTHYFACVAAVCIYGYVFILAIVKKYPCIFRLLVGGLCCAGGYLPWLIRVVTQQVREVKENYWIPPVSWKTLGGCVKFLCKPSVTNEKLAVLCAVLLFLVYIIIVFAFGICWRRRKEEYTKDAFLIGGALLSLGGIVVFGIVASIILRPIFVYRYMLPAIGVFWLAFAVAFTKIPMKKVFRVILLALLLITGLWSYRSFYGEEMWKRVNMASAQEAIDQISQGDAVVCNFDQAQAVTSFYLEQGVESYLWYGTPETLIQRMYPQNHPLVEGEFSDEQGYVNLKKLISETNGTVWFLGSGNARDEIIEKWEAQGIHVEEQNSVLIECYWFNLYTLTL